jgi:dTDP-4-dehydrorhamnose 3,5-epimerase
MHFEATNLVDAFVVHVEPHHDDRGYFARAFCQNEFEQHGLPTHFPQGNLSRNKLAGTLRGMHYQAAPHAEAKLVRCVRGAIYDVILDLRPGSATRFQSFGVELSAERANALFIPAGFAHGFITLLDDTDVLYQMSAFFHAGSARGLRWNDPRFGLYWPREPAVMSERDRTYPDFDPEAFDG